MVALSTRTCYLVSIRRGWFGFLFRNHSMMVRVFGRGLSAMVRGIGTWEGRIEVGGPQVGVIGTVSAHSPEAC